MSIRLEHHTSRASKFLNSSVVIIQVSHPWVIVWCYLLLISGTTVAHFLTVYNRLKRFLGGAFIAQTQLPRAWTIYIYIYPTRTQRGINSSVKESTYFHSTETFHEIEIERCKCSARVFTKNTWSGCPAARSPARLCFFSHARAVGPCQPKSPSILSRCA